MNPYQPIVETSDATIGEATEASRLANDTSCSEEVFVPAEQPQADVPDIDVKAVGVERDTYRVLLLLDYASEFDRKLLRGIVRYSTEHGPWLFYRLPQSYREKYGDKGVVKWARKWGASAIVGRLDNDTIDVQKELGIPVVLQNYHHRRVSCSNLTGDYRTAGIMAARFFRKKIFTNFAYFGIKNIIWSEERRDAFREELEAEGYKVDCFDYTERTPEGKLRPRVEEWLKGLPKPIALFCCDDERAIFISETCKIAGISIPEEVAILGVDNDDLMCNISDPPISSIELGVESGGYAIGELLHGQMKNGISPNASNVVISPVRIEQRRSTERYNISDPYVLKVVRHIENNYDSDLSVENILASIPLSRRNFEMKFKKELNISVYQYILNCRCNRLADLLLTTGRSVMDLAIEVGFKDGGNVSRVFKKNKGLSPIEYRASKGMHILPMDE
ncbi:MAG: substrate-binding domain-containing protein [Tidjanibacter sp.]|nr:substrate-binding domain-containing protein [Tidjanibacter sp.]